MIDAETNDHQTKEILQRAVRSFETMHGFHTHTAHLIPPSTAVIATRCLGGRFTRIRITLDVKYVPISMDRSNDSTCAGIVKLTVAGLEGGAAREQR